MSRPRVPPAATRAFALALGGVHLAFQLLSLAHAVLVPHAVCEEHGEPVHLVVGRAAAPRAAAAAWAPARAAGRPDAHGEEHCAITAHGLAGTAAAAAAAHVRPAPPRQATAAATAVAPPGCAPLLALAPKTSPPV
ncbi:MAG TPA: hypothetical protein VGQ83_14545 [Polyangia bacterium]|jgi:hypothetical protein